MEKGMTHASISVIKEDPRYIAATIKQLPSLSDPKEVRIIEVMKERILSTDASRETVRQLMAVVAQNWHDALSHLSDPEYVHRITQEGAAEAAKAARVKIANGIENLDQLEKGSPVMIVSNHLGIFKLVSMNPGQLRQEGIKEHDVPTIYYPYLTYYMPFQPIGEILGDGVYEASFEQPGKLGQLFRSAGNIDVPPSEFSEDRVNTLTELSRDLIEAHGNAALVVFPEGGTTGKRSEGEIYSLEKFHKGAFVIAAQLGIPVLPVAQRFDINRGGLDLGVLKPFSVQPNMPQDYYQQLASSTQEEMQTWLDQRKAA